MFVLGGFFDCLQRRSGQLSLLRVMFPILDRTGSCILLTPHFILEQLQIQRLERPRAESIRIVGLVFPDEFILLE